MQKDMLALKALVTELEKTRIDVLKVEGEMSDPGNYSITDLTINSRDCTAYSFYLEELWKQVIDSQVILALSPARRDNLKGVLTSVKNSFFTFPNAFYHPEYSSETYFTSRRDLEVNFSRESEWLVLHNKSDQVIESIATKLHLELDLLLQMIEALITQCDGKTPIDRENNFYSYHFKSWFRSPDTIRNLQSTLERNNRIEIMTWKQFSQLFRPETNRPVTQRVTWLGNVSEFKLLIDTLFKTGKFMPGNKKWDVAARCFIIKNRPDFNWKTMRLQKHPKYTPKYIDDIEDLFSKV